MLPKFLGDIIGNNLERFNYINLQRKFDQDILLHAKNVPSNSMHIFFEKILIYKYSLKERTLNNECKILSPLLCLYAFGYAMLNLLINLN